MTSFFLHRKYSQFYRIPISQLINTIPQTENIHFYSNGNQDRDIDPYCASNPSTNNKKAIIDVKYKAYKEDIIILKMDFKSKLLKMLYSKDKEVVNFENVEKTEICQMDFNVERCWFPCFSFFSTVHAKFELFP